MPARSDDQISQTTDLSELLSTYYDKKLLARLTPRLRYYTFGEKKPIPGGEGKSIIWNRLTNQGTGGLLTEGTSPSAKMLSSTQVSATTVQYGDLVRTSDLLETTAICNIISETVSMLGDMAGETLDTYVRDRVTMTGSALGPLSACSCGFYTSGFCTLYSTAAGTMVGEQWTPSNFVCASGMKTAALTVSGVRKAVYRLRKLNARPYPDGYYRGVINPTVSNQLEADSVWQTWNQYSGEGLRKMEQGEIGMVEGVRFVDTTLAKSYSFSSQQVSTALGSSLGTIYSTLILAQGAYGVAEIAGLGGVKTYVVNRTKPDKTDPLQQYSLIGYKITTAAQILNASCAVQIITNEA